MPAQNPMGKSDNILVLLIVVMNQLLILISMI